MKSSIWAVCKDPGGTAAIIPVVEELTRRGYKTRLIANGYSAQALRATGEPFEAASSADALLADGLRPNLLLTSMCSQGGIGRELVAKLRGSCPTVALQDFWGARLWTDWKARSCRPDYICVNDEIGAEIARYAWPDGATRVAVTGYPALDHYATMDTECTRLRCRAAASIDNDAHLVVCASSNRNSAELLEELVGALSAIDEGVFVVPLLHPRLEIDSPAELALTQDLLGRLPHGTVIDRGDFTTSDWIAAATVVVAEFSTVLVESAAIHKQAIGVLYPRFGLRRLREGVGGLMREFPLSKLGCCAEASDRAELTILLAAALKDSLGLEQAQRANFQLDGRSASRVADLVDRLAGSA